MAQNIVIVGGGGAGVAIARELSAKLPKLKVKYNLILITSHERYVHMPALPRMAVNAGEKLEDTAFVPYDTVFVNGYGKAKVGKVTSIERSTDNSGGAVLLEGGERVPFRFVVVATGSLWEGPLGSLSERMDDIRSTIQQWRERFKNAKSVVIIGGGTVGLELAGELRDIYPTKKIIIVHAGHLPLNEAYPDRFRKDVLRRWQERGVEFALGDRIDEYPLEGGGSVTTMKGSVINSDLFVPARGGRPNTAFLKSVGSDVLDARGYVSVSSTLQFEHYPYFFAAGDIIAFPEQKQLAKVPGHVGVVAANILSLAVGKPPKKNYAGTFEGVFITNGKTKGAGYVGIMRGLNFGDKVVPMLKGKDLFVSAQRKSMGLSA